jgi:ABC-type cobalamin transport system permease subunit
VDVKNETIRQILLYFKQFALGNLALTIPIAIGSYFLAIILLRFARKMRLRKTGRRGKTTV